MRKSFSLAFLGPESARAYPGRRDRGRPPDRALTRRSPGTPGALLDRGRARTARFQHRQPGLERRETGRQTDGIPLERGTGAGQGKIRFRRKARAMHDVT